MNRYQSALKHHVKQMNLFHKATNKYLALFIIFGLLSAGCSSSGSSERSTKIPASTSISQEQNAQGQPSPNKTTQGKAASEVPSTTVDGQSSLTPSQLPTGPTLIATTLPPQIVPSTLPRFVSFTCNVTVNDTTQQPTPTTRAIRIDVEVDQTNLSSVATAVTTSGVTKRLLIPINKLGKGHTQVVVPDSAISYVSIFASPDFFPESTMCSNRG
jgi:hypothetical protein